MARRARRLAAVMAFTLPKHARVLDVGSGNGRLAELIMKIRPDLEIEGIDIMVWREQKIKIRQFDGASIPDRANEWDYCLVSDVLHHCNDRVGLLKEMLRVSEKGILIKDHTANTKFDHVILSILDWAGNRGHGVSNTFDYWSSEKWNDTFSGLDLHEEFSTHTLSLYPWPFSWLLDRKLHFVTLLVKNTDPGSQSVGNA
jgi:ubiquinone/menaquinone biosynthesis C-methylase UbiE